MIYQECKICRSEIAGFLNQFELLKCSKCGFIFYKHSLNDKDTVDLYDKLYNKEESYSQFKSQAESLRKGIQPRLGYDKRKVINYLLKKHCRKIIEIGAGVGIAGNFLQKKNIEYQGIELDQEAAKLANEAGVNVKNDSFEFISNFQNNHAVIAFEVLEHIDDLKLCFELIHNALMPGGHLGFTVPNFERFKNLNDEEQKNGLGQVGPPVHINFFTIDFLKRILPDFGFQVCYLHTRPFPHLNWKKRNTYKNLWKSMLGQYHGPTIICIAKTIN